MFKNLETVSRTGFQRVPLKDWPSKLLHNKYKILEVVGEGKYGYLLFIYLINSAVFKAVNSET